VDASGGGDDEGVERVGAGVVVAGEEDRGRGINHEMSQAHSRPPMVAWAEAGVEEVWR